MSMSKQRMERAKDCKSMLKTVYTVKLVILKILVRILTGYVPKVGKGQLITACNTSLSVLTNRHESQTTT